jgi:hypothetical protein
MCPEEIAAVRLFDGELDPGLERPDSAHLETCESCRSVVDGYRFLGEALSPRETGIHSGRMEEIFNAVVSSCGAKERVGTVVSQFPRPSRSRPRLYVCFSAALSYPSP